MSLFEQQTTEFQRSHIGPNEEQLKQMLAAIGVNNLEELMNSVVPDNIRMEGSLSLPPAMGESEYLRHIKEVSLKNKVFRNYIGQGYYDTITPSVILRNIFENPGWYTQYTPYQAKFPRAVWKAC